jgi:hypothetical protein
MISPPATEGRRRRYTLTEVMIATSLGLILMAGMFTFVVMAATKLKTFQAQVMFNHTARYGAAKITRLVEAGQLVVSSSSTQATIIFPGTIGTGTLTYENADRAVNTILDNAIWYYPPNNAARQRLAVAVSPLKDASNNDLPVFQLGMDASGVTTNSLVAQFHVGDAPTITGSSATTGPGYQGVRVIITVKPRNTGMVWTGGGFE